MKEYKQQMVVAMNKLYALAIGISLIFIPLLSHASHVVGMDMEYEHQGNGVYRVWVSIYSDCSGIPAPSTLNLQAFTPNGCTPFSSTSPIIATLGQQCLYPGSHLPNGATCEVSNICDSLVASSCCSSGSANCVNGISLSTYSGLITLPTGSNNQRCAEWILAASNCTRSPTITNISNPSSQCTYVYAEVNDSLQNTLTNHSPQWTQRNHWLSGIGQITELDFSCIDPDGDSLAYRLVPAFESWNTPVIYSGGFSFLQPFLVTNFGQALNIQTGVFSLRPATIQQGVVAVVVEEYRNGVQIGSIRRDMTLLVNQTLPSSPAVISNIQSIGFGQLDPEGRLRVCEGDTAAFSFLLRDTFQFPVSAAIHPDFSVPGMSLSTSPTSPDSLFCTLRFAASQLNAGCHEVVIQTWVNACPIKIPRLYRFEFCSDNSSQGFTQDTIRSCGEPVTLPGFDGFTHQWTPPTGLSNAFIQNPTAFPTISLWYTLSSSCLTDSLYLDNQGLAGGFTFSEPCYDSLMTVQFQANVIGNPDTFIWSYGDGNGSAGSVIPNHVYDYTAGTSVNVRLITGNQAGCTDTVNQTLNFDTDCVWPGDADKDGLVTHFDLFPIGLRFGALGPNRPAASIFFDPQKSTDWGDTLVGGIDIKHANTDGDSIIQYADTLAIVQNWALAHLKGKPAKRSFSDVPLFPRIPADTIATSAMPPLRDEVTVPIQLGVDTLQVDSIYGLAFSFHYQKELIDSNSIHVHFNQSLFGNKNQTMLSLFRNHPEDGRVDIALVGINGINRNGWGDVAAVKYVMQDDIAGKTNTLYYEYRQLRHEISNVRAISLSQTPVSLDILGDTAVASFSFFTGLNSISAFEARVWPNPAGKDLRIRADEPLKEALIIDMLGKEVLHQTFDNNSTEQILDLRDLAPGHYVLELLGSSGYYKTTLQKLPY